MFHIESLGEKKAPALPVRMHSRGERREVVHEELRVSRRRFFSTGIKREGTENKTGQVRAAGIIYKGYIGFDGDTPKITQFSGSW